jgi:hypothetical protein
VKGLGGLGLSVAGGVDSCDPYPGLVRIKRLFPHQAAWMTGQLQSGNAINFNHKNNNNSIKCNGS